MATENIPWAVHLGLMMSRMAGLGKPDAAVRPVDIGDINWRFVAKIILLVTGEDAMEACSSDQLCARLKFGCEGGVHGMTAAFDVASVNEDAGFMLVDADNAFNSFSRNQMLWNVCHAWLAGAWFAFYAVGMKTAIIWSQFLRFASFNNFLVPLIAERLLKSTYLRWCEKFKIPFLDRTPCKKIFVENNMVVQKIVIFSYI